MMKYTIFNLNKPDNTVVPNDVFIIGIDRTWKFRPDVKMVYFTRMDAFMEFINSGNDKYGIPVCGNELVNDANKVGRFSVIRNLLRSKKIQYHDNVGNIETTMRKIMVGSRYVQMSTNETKVEKQPEKTHTDGPLVSVIIPHYNRSEIVKKSIESIINQTYRNIEILVVDDCSNAAHFDELSKYLSELGDARIKLYRCSKNCGPYVCKNEMIAVAKGELITLQDSDDVSDLDRIQTQVECMRNEEVRACSVGVKRYNTQSEYKYCLASAMYRRCVFEDVGFFDTVRYGADSEFNERVRMYYGDAAVVAIPKRMYHASFSADCLTSIVPQGTKDRNDYYSACLVFLHNNHKSKYYTDYPNIDRKFYTPAVMIADITGMTCNQYNLGDYEESSRTDRVDFVILVTTYNRPEMMLRLLKNLKSCLYDYAVHIRVYNDGSNSDYSKVLSYLKSEFNGNNVSYYYWRGEVNGGIEKYWKLTSRMFGDMRTLNYKYVIQLDDDVTVVSDFLTKARERWEAIDDVDKVCLNILADSRVGKSSWTDFAPIPVRFKKYNMYRSQWVDMHYIAERRFMESLDYRINEIKRNWKENKHLGAGVGGDMSTRLHKKKLSMYQLVDTLVFHENQTSELTPHLDRSMHYVVDTDRQVYVNVASIPSRVFALKEVVESLLPQCDGMRVFLNGYAAVPDFLESDKIKVYRSQNIFDFGDAGKFYDVRETHGYYLSVDDDIVYPADYVQNTVRAIEKYGRRAIVSYHGRRFVEKPKVSMHKTKCDFFHFAERCKNDEYVHVGGTGVMGFHSSTIRLDISDFGSANMADIWMAVHAQMQHVPIIVPAHDKLWLKAMKIEMDTTLYDASRRDESRIMEVFNYIQKWELYV